MANTLTVEMSDESESIGERSPYSAGTLATQRGERTFGDKFRAIRERLGLTQPQFAKRLGQSTSYVSLLESNQRPPTERVLANLRAAVELTAEEDAEFPRVSEVRDPLAQLIQYAVSVLGARAGADDYYRLLIRDDLTRLFRGYLNLLQGEQYLATSKFSQAAEQFDRIVNGPDGRAITATLRAAAEISLADVALKQGNPETAAAAVSDAQELLDTALPCSAFSLHAEAHAMRGMIDLRAGDYAEATTTMTEALNEYKKMPSAEPREQMVAAGGLTKSYNRLALLALLKGDPAIGESYCISALAELKRVNPDENDLTDTRRTRILALQAWAWAASGYFREARAQRERLLEAYTANHDDYGIAKSWLYMADDARLEIQNTVEAWNDALADPQTRLKLYHQRLNTVEMRKLVRNAIHDYHEAITCLERLGEAMLLSRAFSGLGEMHRYNALLSPQDACQEKEAAEKNLQHALDLEQRAKEGRRTPGTLEALARLEWDGGYLARAHDLFEQARSSMLATEPRDDNAAADRLERYTQSVERIRKALKAASQTPVQPHAAPAPGAISRPSNRTERHATANAEQVEPAERQRTRR